MSAGVTTTEPSRPAEPPNGSGAIPDEVRADGAAPRSLVETMRRAREAAARAMGELPVTSIDPTASTPLLSRLARAALLFFLSGASLALAFQLASMGATLGEFAQHNTLPTSARRLLLATMSLAGLGACVPAAVWLTLRPNRTTVARIERAARIASPLLLACFVPLLFQWRVFRDHPLPCAVTTLIVGLGLERLARSSFAALPARFALGSPAWPRPSRRVAAVLVGAIALSFAAYFSYYTIVHHFQIETQSYDLAIFDNLEWNLLRGKWFKSSPAMGRIGSHLERHATFGAYFFLPFYALRQSAETLLALQATFVGLGAIPIYLLAVRRVGSRAVGLAFAYAYVVHAPLHGPVFYDFHFVTTAPFWIGWVLYLFDTRRTKLLVAAWLAALLIREDQSACLAAASLFFLLTGDRPLVALAGGVLSTLYFVVVKFVVMPAHQIAGPSEESFTWMFSGLIPAGEKGFGAVLKTVLTNPVFTLESLLDADKVTYVLEMTAPLLLLPFRSARSWLLVLPAAIFTLLSTGYKPLYTTSFQYTANWTPYLFFGAMVTLGSWRVLADGRTRIAAAAVALVVAATAQSYQRGAIFQHNDFVGGFKGIRFALSDADRQNHRDLYDLIAMIPKSASVAASETEAPHVSNRADCFTLRFGHEDADYLLVNVDAARGGSEHGPMVTALATGKYGFVARRGRFALWGKDRPHDHDDEGRRIVQ